MAFRPMVFGKYILLKRIAIGGMAEVFRAKAYGAEGFEKLAAVKRMLPHLSADSQFVDMFINEAKLAAALNHVNVAQIYDFGCIDNQHFISMEYVQGKDIADIIRRLRDKNLAAPVELACHVFIDTLNGLDYAHRQLDSYGNPLELIHRDMSPHNILVSYEGEVKIVDFGIAKATSSTVHTTGGVLKGKYSYMSPEQARGEPLDHRSDIFSLAICFYELLTLTKMFSGESDLAVLEKVRETEFIRPRQLNPEIPDELEAILMNALARRPMDRYESAAQLRDDLEQFLFASDLHFTTSWLAGFMRQVFAEDIQAERQDFSSEAKEVDHFRAQALAAARVEASKVGATHTAIDNQDLRALMEQAKRKAPSRPPDEQTYDSGNYTEELPPLAPEPPLATALTDEIEELSTRKHTAPTPEELKLAVLKIKKRRKKLSSPGSGSTGEQLLQGLAEGAVASQPLSPSDFGGAKPAAVVRPDWGDDNDFGDTSLADDPLGHERKGFPFGLVLVLLLVGVVVALVVFLSGREDKTQEGDSADRIDGSVLDPKALDQALAAATRIPDPGDAEPGTEPATGPGSFPAQTEPTSGPPDPAEPATSPVTPEKVEATPKPDPVEVAGPLKDDKKVVAAVDPRRPPIKPPKKGKRKKIAPPPKEDKGYGTISVGVAGGWGTVFVDGTKIDNTPVVNHRLLAGSHKIEIKDPQGNLIRSWKILLKKDGSEHLVHQP